MFTHIDTYADIHIRAAFSVGCMADSVANINAAAKLMPMLMIPVSVKNNTPLENTHFQKTRLQRAKPGT